MNRTLPGEALSGTQSFSSSPIPSQPTGQSSTTPSSPITNSSSSNLSGGPLPSGWGMTKNNF